MGSANREDGDPLHVQMSVFSALRSPSLLANTEGEYGQLVNTSGFTESRPTTTFSEQELKKHCSKVDWIRPFPFF